MLIVISNELRVNNEDPKITSIDRIFPFKRQSHQMVKHTQTNRRQQATNCLSVFECGWHLKS